MKEENARGWALENAKVIADLMTGVRFFLSLLIVICALFAEPSLLPLVVCLTLLGWTTDVIDGKMARMDPYGRRTWIGDRDFAVDMVLIYSGLLYFITAGFVPFWPFLFYMAFAAATAIVWTKKSVMMAVAAPIAAMPIVFSFLHARLWGWVFLGWIALALLCNWKRFVREIGEFIEDVEKG
ncbi:MAG: CDP-alcohol phosphatidyltransferase family protein [Actinobacteria bacterium]|nr:CDP-alcohol phosphatidyltransferase family protein [Actinomycetota bacterium]